MGAERHDIGIAGHRTLVRMHGMHDSAIALDGAHRGVECKADPHAAAVLGQAAGEHEGIPRTFIRRKEAAADEVLDRPEHRLDGDAPVGIGILKKSKPVVAQQCPFAVAFLKGAGGPEQVKMPASLPP